MDDNGNGDGLLNYSEENNASNSSTATVTSNLNETSGQQGGNNSSSNGGKKGGAGKIIGIIVGIVAVVAVVVCGVMAFSGKWFGSKLFASEGKRFVQLATKDQKFLQVLKSADTTSQLNTDLEIKFDELLKAFGESEDVGNLLFSSKEVKDGNDFSLVATLAMEGMEDANIELQVARTGDIVGINMPDITDRFVAVDVSDIDGLMKNLEKLGILTYSYDFDGIENSDEERENSVDYEKIQSEFKKLIEKYVDVLAKNIDDYIEKTPNVNLKVGDYSEKTTEYVFKVNGKNVVELFLILEKELLKNEEDIEKLVEIGMIEDAEAFSDMLEEDIANNEEVVKSSDFLNATEEVLTIKLYEKDGKNLGTILDVDGIQFGFYVFEESNNNYEFIFQMKAEDAEFDVNWAMTQTGNIKNGSLGFTYVDSGNEIKATVCELKIEELAKATEELIKIDKNSALILNTATEDELEEFYNEVMNNLDKLMPTLPTDDNGDSLIPLPTDDDVWDSIGKPTESGDDDFNSTGKNNNKAGDKINISGGYLKAAQSLYNKIEPDMTRAQIVAAIGEPTKTSSYIADTESLRYIADDENDTTLLTVSLSNDKVTTIEISVSSSNYRKIYLSQELNADIDDLNTVVDKVEDDMTIEEVENILGKNYFQSSKSDHGTTRYTWYDKNDSSVTISTRENTKDGTTKELVTYVGTIFEL